MTNSLPETKAQLARLSDTLLNSDRPSFTLRPELQQTVELLTSINGFSAQDSDSISLGESHTDEGLAVSATMAAMCADDTARTLSFIRGLNKAIKQVKNDRPEQKVHVLYIGCGPFAIQALPQMLHFSPEQIGFTLVDIHSSTLDSVKKLIDRLGLEEFVDEFRCQDAAGLQLAKDNLPDIVVMEIMQACLQAEPQVAVSRHIMSQAPEALLIPEQISIQLKLADINADLTPKTSEIRGHQHILIGDAFILCKNAVRQWQTFNGSTLPGKRLTLPEKIHSSFQPMLFTKLKVYADEVIENYDSGLTTPRHLAHYCPASAGDSLQFSYQLGAQPQLIAEMA